MTAVGTVARDSISDVCPMAENTESKIDVETSNINSNLPYNR